MLSTSLPRRTTPLSVAGSDSPAQTGDPRQQGRGESARPRALLVDDSLTLQFTLKDALVAAGDLEGSLVLGLTEMVKLPPQAVEGYRRAPEWAEQVANAASWPREGHALIAMDPGTAALSGVDVPTVMLVGEVSQDFLRASTFAVAETLGDARVVELPGQGHAGLRTAPDLVAETILRELA